MTVESPESEWLDEHALEIWCAAREIAAASTDPHGVFTHAPTGSLGALVEWVADRSRDLKPDQAPGAARLAGEWHQARRGLSDGRLAA